MAAPAYTAITGGAVALAAATAKSVLSVIPAANKAYTLTEVDVMFDGTTATAVPVLVELCSSDATAAGTSTAVTPLRVRGPAATVTSSAAKNYTAEPTTLTVLREWLLPPTAGVLYQLPLGREIEALGVSGAVGRGGLIVRCTAPAIVNVRATVEFEE